MTLVNRIGDKKRIWYCSYIGNVICGERSSDCMVALDGWMDTKRAVGSPKKDVEAKNGSRRLRQEGTSC